jgi:hypothetical protein
VLLRAKSIPSISRDAVFDHKVRPPTRIAWRARTSITQWLVTIFYARYPTKKHWSRFVVLLIRTRLDGNCIAGKTKTVLRYVIIIVGSMDGVSGLSPAASLLVKKE